MAPYVASESEAHVRVNIQATFVWI